MSAAGSCDVPQWQPPVSVTQWHTGLVWMGQDARDHSNPLLIPPQPAHTALVVWQETHWPHHSRSLTTALQVRSVFLETRPQPVAVVCPALYCYMVSGHQWARIHENSQVNEVFTSICLRTLALWLITSEESPWQPKQYQEYSGCRLWIEWHFIFTTSHDWNRVIDELLTDFLAFFVSFTNDPEGCFPGFHLKLVHLPYNTAVHRTNDFQGASTQASVLYSCYEQAWPLPG